MRNQIKTLLIVLFCSIFYTQELQASKAQYLNDSLTLITRHRADKLLALLSKKDPWEQMPDASTLAWVESTTLQSLVNLYEATDDTQYLIALARKGDRLLSHRDDKRGIVDGSGKSRPAWSMGSKYVVAQAELLDAAGKAVIHIRSTPSSNNLLTYVELIPSSGNPARFTLSVSNSFYKRYEQFSDLSLNPADDRFIEKIINDPMAPYSAGAGTFTDKSNLIRVAITGSPTLPHKQTVKLKPIPLAYMGYLGIIYDPMLRFAELVKADSKLNNLKPAADRFIKAAEESYTDAASRLWREGPNKDEGYYLTCEKGESFPADNVGAPFNFLARHVCAELALYRLTGKVAYLERSKKMATLLKNRLQYDAAANLYTWNYWYEPMTTKGWEPADNLSANVKYFKPAPNVEDISHGALDIAMVVAANKAGIVFNDEDVRRFTNTLLINILTPEFKDVKRTVAGGIVYPPYFSALQGWLELAKGNPEVYHAIRKAYIYRGEENLAFCANLLKWEKKLDKTLKQ